ncbi:hypothetical protein OsJ_11168 [Oryza sativa Japonica Group]|uniref:F-box domain-containing protein n=1 Tax=Oryza sativa subsp. japonica TaxID=39947 RepID=B9F8W4_ORYSJ|nr:hypothetical protein OsJ_11168 [Oryza sativa Japonica Group]
MASMAARSSRKRRSPPPRGLGDLHDDVLERVLARLPPATFFRLRAVCRRWSAAAASPTFLRACARVPSRDPWFLMLSGARPRPPLAFDAAGRSWILCRAAPGGSDGGADAAVPVASSGGLVLYRARARASSSGSWEGPVALSRRPDAAALLPDDAPSQGGADDTVYFLSKSGDVVATNMQRSASKQYSSVVVAASSDGGDAVAYFLSHSGTVVACDTARRTFAELPRILPVYFEYSIDVVACDGAAYAVVLAEYLDTASLRVWGFAGGAWRQVAAMPPAMSHAFHGKKADINCVGHGGRLMVCVSSGEANGCFMCDVGSNQWEELPKCVNGDGEVNDFLAAFSFEPRLEISV